MGWLHDLRDEMTSHEEIAGSELGALLANELKGDDEYQATPAVNDAAKSRSDAAAEARHKYSEQYGCKGPICSSVSRFVSGWYAVRNMQRAQLGYGAGFSPLFMMGSGRMGPTRGYEFEY